MPEPILIAVNCPFNLLQSFQDGVHQVKRMSPSCKLRMLVTVSISELSCMRGPRPRMHDRSAVHSAQCQDLELILRRLLQHENRRERKERVVYASHRPTDKFMRACPRPTEAACLRERKCPKNCQLIVASIQRFL